MNVTTGLGTVTQDDGVGVTSAVVNGFSLAELDFPAGYVQGWSEPASAYLAVVLEGALVKRFRHGTMELAAGLGVTMPGGESHDARFGARGARIVIVKVSGESAAFGACLERLACLRRPGLDWLAWRLAGELRASDSAAPVAAEGIALELLASAGREACPERGGRSRPRWLSAIEEELRERTGEHVGLSELAGRAGVDAGHLARVFRAHHGVSVGEYARRVRLASAAAELARTDLPLAIVAARAGFADQSHFTRLFRRHVGLTPARYRAETRGTRDPTASLSGGVQDGPRTAVT